MVVKSLIEEWDSLVIRLSKIPANENAENKTDK